MRVVGTASPMQRKPPNAKKGLTARLRARKRAKKLALEIAVKALVRMRDGDLCRVCYHHADSVHEIRPKSLGGDVSLTNSIACCGDGVRGCHGFMQRHEIQVTGVYGDVDADKPLLFTPETDAARKWLASR